MVGLTRLELVTPRLSSVCSNQLSYRPSDTSMKNNLLWILTNRQSFVKEVIQPQVPLRLDHLLNERLTIGKNPQQVVLHRCI